MCENPDRGWSIMFAVHNRFAGSDYPSSGEHFHGISVRPIPGTVTNHGTYHALLPASR